MTKNQRSYINWVEVANRVGRINRVAGQNRQFSKSMSKWVGLA